MKDAIVRDSTLRHLGSAAIYTLVTIVLLGLVYPFAITGLAMLLFPQAAAGSYVRVGDRIVGARSIGQSFTSAKYFNGRPSAAGKNGYDPTATGGTNFGPTSKKLIDATRASVTALRKANPKATLPVPMDLVTSSGSGIDPEISLEAALYQVPRIAQARGLTEEVLRAIVRRNVEARTFGLLGEPRVNVLSLNIALDGQSGKRALK